LEWAQNGAMNLLIATVGRALRGLLRLWLFALAAALVGAILLVALSVALLSSVWLLLTGRKPAAFTVFQQWRQAARPFKPGGWPGESSNETQAADVVDVQAREIPPALLDRKPPAGP
jgi:hypothetical protein